MKEAGADGIACSDAYGPALKIDIRTGEPALGGPRGVGGLTGPAIMPLTLRMVLEIASTVDLPIVGVGGVETAADVVEYLMAGATLVGVCTAGHLKGPARYTRLLRDLETLLAELGVSSPAEVRGLALRRIRERKEKGLVAVTRPVVPTVDEEKCTACRRCEEACAYGSMRVREGGAGGRREEGAGPGRAVHRVRVVRERLPRAGDLAGLLRAFRASLKPFENHGKEDRMKKTLLFLVMVAVCLALAVPLFASSQEEAPAGGRGPRAADRGEADPPRHRHPRRAR